mgnify:CR=1 FL=1
MEPNRAFVSVPDDRFNRLVKADHPEKVSPAHLEVVDIAGYF